MNSLFDISTRIRKILLFAAIILLVVIGGDTLIRFLNSPLNPFFAQPSFYIDANNALGEIPVPQIPTQAIDDSSQPAFFVETSQLPVYPDTAYVYRIEEPREKLNTIENARKTASALGFSSAFSELEGGKIEWKNQAASRSLQFDRNLQTWRMRTQYFVDAEAAKAKELQADIKFYDNKGKSVASGLGFGVASISQGEVVSKFAKLGVNGLFTSPLTSTSSDYVTVDVFRKFSLSRVRNGLSQQVLQSARAPRDFDGKVYTNDPRIGSLHMVVTNSVNDLGKDLYELDFVNYEYSTTPGVYRVISPAEAWERIRVGRGALMLLTTQGADYFAPSEVLNVSRFVANAPTVEIGYWEPPITDANRYLFPIYIFRGRAEFADNRPAGEFTFFVDALLRSDS